METVIAIALVGLSAALLTLRAVRRARALSAPQPTDASPCGGCTGCSPTAGEAPSCAIRLPDTLPLLLLAVALAPGLARAADTIEVFDAGVADLEGYVSLDGEELGGELVLGYSLTPRLSASFATSLATGSALALRGRGQSFGLVASAFDGEHLDLDLFGALALADEQLSLCPGVELNLDQPGWGLYSRVLPAFVPGGVELEVHGGAWLMPREGWQVLVEPRLVWADGLETAVGLGLNLGLTEEVELISEVEAAPGDEGVALVASVGFIAAVR